MKFCHNCGNKISPFEEENILKYKCNDCNTIVENNNSIISESHYKYDFITDTHLSIKSNRRYDNSIKRSKKHNCPNDSCNNSWNKEVIIGYDHEFTAMQKSTSYSIASVAALMGEGKLDGNYNQLNYSDIPFEDFKNNLSKLGINI